MPDPKIEPLDPDSEKGRRIAAALSELFDDVCDRLHREGTPLPAALQPKNKPRRSA